LGRETCISRARIRIEDGDACPTRAWIAVHTIEFAERHRATGLMPSASLRRGMGLARGTPGICPGVQTRPE
jgi:hypothetical protein